MRLHKILLASSVALFGLIGCGDGGGSSSDNQQGNNQQVDNKYPNSYLNGSQNQKIFNYLNQELQRCGFGTLTQNAQIDSAATNHVNYMFTNNLVSHQEQANKPGFTGISINNRLDAVGYNYKKQGISAGEVLASISSSNSNTVQNSGVALLRNLLIAPYHMTTFVSGFKNVGINYQTGSINGNQSALLIADFGVPSSENSYSIASNNVLTYPCQGSTNIKPALFNEYPNPVPGRNLKNNPIGSSIILRANLQGNLSVTSTELKEVATGKKIALLPTLTKQNDQNRQLFAFEAIIMPSEALKNNTTYQANITGSNNGSAFTKNFTFTTGE